MKHTRKTRAQVHRSISDRVLIPLIICGLMTVDSTAQTNPSPAYIAPLDIPLDLAGNFMEPRSDHFHSGLDLRTQGREGLPVRAVADGWVSRVKVSPWGYGKAVYIDHPDGRTSVYGHLQSIDGPIGEAVLAKQYQLQAFEIDWNPEKGALPVKQGEVFALSGNTGGSGGPHLHFELRRTSDQVALDPESLGIVLADHKAPEILGVRLYALTDSTRLKPYPAGTVGYAASGVPGRYALKEAPAAFGTVGLALHTIDRYDANGAKCGVRSIELFVDSAPVFSSRFEQIDFSLNRYCNAHMDYGEFKGNRHEYHRCYRLPNNKLRIYGKEEPQGRIALAPGQTRQVRFVVTDKHGNVSTLTFQLRGASANEAKDWPGSHPEGSLFRYDAAGSVKEEGLRFNLPANALYDDAYVAYSRSPAIGRALTPIHRIGDPMIPLHSPAEISLALNTPNPGKAVVVRLTEKGEVSSAVGGRYADGWITASVKSFGSYTAMLDTTPPVIKNVDLRADMKGRKTFTVEIADNLSGIDKWNATLNGEWIMMEYDPKTKRLTHRFDAHTQAPGSKEFVLVVTDDRGNSSRYRMSLVH